MLILKEDKKLKKENFVGDQMVIKLILIEIGHTTLKKGLRKINFMTLMEDQNP